MEKVIFYLVLASFAIVIVEYFYDRKYKKNLYSHRDIIQCFYLLSIYNVISFSVKFLLQRVDPYFNEHVSPAIPMNTAANWILLTILYDLAYYWTHRLEHGNAWVWKSSHIHHHSSRYLNYLTGFRASYLQPIYALLFIFPLYLLGFRTPEILGMIAFNKLFNFWIHSQHLGKLGWLERVINTPSNHRVHHGRNPQYIDKNFAGIFMVWDKIFGTYELEVEPVQFGVHIDPEHLSPREVFAMGFKK